MPRARSRCSFVSRSSYSSSSREGMSLYTSSGPLAQPAVWSRKRFRLADLLDRELEHTFGHAHLHLIADALAQQCPPHWRFVAYEAFGGLRLRRPDDCVLH